MDAECSKAIVIRTNAVKEACLIIEKELKTTNYKVIDKQEIRLYDYLDNSEKVNKVLAKNDIDVFSIYESGISGLAFSYGVIGLYILIKLFIYTKTKIFKQVSFYLLTNIILIMFIMINPFVAGVQSMIIHIVAVVFGTIFTVIKHKDIDLYLKNVTPSTEKNYLTFSKYLYIISIGNE